MIHFDIHYNMLLIDGISMCLMTWKITLHSMQCLYRKGAKRLDAMIIQLT